MYPKSAIAMIIILLGLLAASAAGNYYLFKKALLFYTREAEVRMNPVDLRRYADKNATLLSQEKTQPRIVMFGESRCSMWQLEPPKNWGEVEIVNRGIGGETTPQIKRRLEADVIALDPDLVILQMGDNDLKTMAMLKGQKDWIIEETYENITEIASKLGDSGIQVLITTIFPPAEIELLRAPLWSPEVNESIDLVNQRLLAFESPNVTVVDCDAFLRKGDYIDPRFAIDTLHINLEGYKALNSGLENTIKLLLAAE